MSDTKRILNDLDQRHQAYTKKFGLIKARFDKLEGALAELLLRVVELEKAAAKKGKR